MNTALIPEYKDTHDKSAEQSEPREVHSEGWIHRPVVPGHFQRLEEQRLISDRIDSREEFGICLDNRRCLGLTSSVQYTFLERVDLGIDLGQYRHHLKTQPIPAYLDRCVHVVLRFHRAGLEDIAPDLDILVENSPVLDPYPEAIGNEILFDPSLLADLVPESTDNIARMLRSHDDGSRHD